MKALVVVVMAIMSLWPLAAQYSPAPEGSVAIMADNPAVLAASPTMPIARILMLAVASVVVCALGFFLLIVMVKRISKKINSVPDEKFFKIRFQKMELISSHQVKMIAVKGLTLAGFLLGIVLALAYLSLLFSFFPATQGIAAQVLQMLVSPLKLLGSRVLDYIPKFFTLVVIFMVARLVLKLAHGLFHGLETGAIKLGHFHSDWAWPTYRLVRLFLFAFVLIIAFPYLPGSDSDAFKGVSIFFGVIFSLGSSGVVSNAVAGILITYMRSFKIGDRIAIDQDTGIVVEKSAFVVRIRTIKNVEVTIPNSKFLGSQVINYSTYAQDRGLIVSATVSIAYSVPGEQAQAILLHAADMTQGLLKTPKPFVLQSGFGDYCLQYQINGYTEQATQADQICSELYAHIHDLCHEAHVELTTCIHHKAM